MNKEHVDQLKYSCSHRESNFETKKSQQEHSKTYHVSKNSESKKVKFSEVNNCTICKKVFINNAQLGEHIDTEHMYTESDQTREKYNSMWQYSQKGSSKNHKANPLCVQWS